jgi:hypothetical protein
MSMVIILAKRPELQKALQREVDEVIGFDREPCLSDRHKCPLADAVILETLRYISHLPLSVFHSASKDTTIAGYPVEKDTVVSYLHIFSVVYFDILLVQDIYLVLSGFRLYQTCGQFISAKTSGKNHLLLDQIVF